MSGTVHRRLTPAPVQKEFPARRRSARQRKSAPPFLTRQQSTLTQLDFVGTSSSPYDPRKGRSIFSIPTDSADDDPDFEEPQPKKKQKTTAQASNKKSGQKRAKNAIREHDQSTMTQCWKLHDYAKDSEESDDGAGDIGLEGALIYPSGADDKCGGQALLAPTERPVSDTLDQAALLSGNIGDAASDSESQITSSPPPRLYRHPALTASSDHGSDTTRPTTAGSDRHPQTPRRERPAVIPSSQTPSSIKLSVHFEPQNRGVYERSPLKNRSTNVSPLKRSGGSSPTKIAPAKLERIQLENDANLGPKEGSIQPLWIAKVACTPKKETKHLERTTTIQDSEEGDLESSSPGKSARAVIRTTIVQQSQLESDMIELDATTDDEDYDQHDDDDMKIEESHDDDEMPEHTYCSLMRQSTFDPVNAALDRDANRFGNATTQLPPQTQQRTQVPQCSSKGGVNAQEFAEETPVEVAALDTDLEERDTGKVDIVVASQRGPSPELGENIFRPIKVEKSIHEEQSEVVLSSQPQEKKQSFSEARSTPARSAHDRLGDWTEAANMNAASPQAASSSGDIAPVETMAPPARRGHTQSHPSQISTVVPSQQSQPNSAYGRPHIQTRTTAPPLPETIPSSPIPLPPWADEGNIVRMNTETQLTDFSLPHPPPLSYSSSRQMSGSSE
ncbi:hypothetical protein HII31_02250 [Pseudocercospora fuligena]|uniref:Uncharacterized protein n=1 Tax=Pseudocercospora fuligena TaxID=685502 RepID=A0A8H6RTE5_9PEZI|nr:hypothetical protein HII31_02250 [Pseudocercospora fuligena]